jgi:hypothetical protein
MTIAALPLFSKCLADPSPLSVTSVGSPQAASRDSSDAIRVSVRHIPAEIYIHFGVRGIELVMERELRFNVPFLVVIECSMQNIPGAGCCDLYRRIGRKVGVGFDQRSCCNL